MKIGEISLDDARARRLADLLVEVARVVDHDVAAAFPARTEYDPQLEALRSVLLEQDRSTLARLQRKVDDPAQFAEAISQVLADALALAGTRDERIASVLAPTLERATQASIRRNPDTLVGILYPLMGPAIRKSIAENLDNTLQRLNQAFKQSFSWQGLKWRFEAFRSGTGYAEAVLNHTVEFRVEHVFLIHRHTGLLLEHVAAPEAAGQDPQLVSGMLSAIQDFVRDSFQQNGKGGEGGIDSLRLGDLLLWCEEGPFAFLAAVIRGSPPESLRQVIRETLSELHQELRVPLEDFEGDSSTLGDLASHLEDCLRQRDLPAEESLSPWLWRIPLAAFLIMGIWMSWRGLEARRFNAYVERLEDEPGVVVTAADRRWGGWRVAGLRDPLSVDPAQLLAEANLNPSRVAGRWETYQALDPEIVVRRFVSRLDPPPTLSFELDEGVIRAVGSAPDHWVDRARALAAAQPAGAPGVDLTAVTDVQDPTFVRLRDAIQAHVISFDLNAPRPAPGQEGTLDRAAAQINELVEAAAELGFSVHVRVVGHTDATGYETSNLSLSAARAEVVRSMLTDRGVAPELLSVRGAGTLESSQGDSNAQVAPPEDTEEVPSDRRVTLIVTTGD